MPARPKDQLSRTRSQESLSRPKASDDDDVEGHLFRPKSQESLSRPKNQESLSRPKASDDDDVEGHQFRARSPSSRGE